MLSHWEEHVANCPQNYCQGHKDNNESDHGHGNHLKDAGVLGSPVLGQNGNLEEKNSLIKYEKLNKTFYSFEYFYLWATSQNPFIISVNKISTQILN